LANRKRDGEQIVVAGHWALWWDGKNGTRVTEVDNQTNERAQAYLASIVESSDDAIIGKTLDGTITSWNRAAAQMFGYEADEICGKSVTLLIPPGHISEEKKFLIGLGKASTSIISNRHGVGRTGAKSQYLSPFHRYGIVPAELSAPQRLHVILLNRGPAQRRVLELQSELLHGSRLGTIGQMAAAITASSLGGCGERAWPRGFGSIALQRDRGPSSSLRCDHRVTGRPPIPCHLAQFWEFGGGCKSDAVEKPTPQSLIVARR
jgi:PAS domain-containing protein